jgi:hypothetical protein
MAILIAALRPARTRARPDCSPQSAPGPPPGRSASGVDEIGALAPALSQVRGHGLDVNRLADQASDVVGEPQLGAPASNFPRTVPRALVLCGIVYRTATQKYAEIGDRPLHRMTA